MKAWWVSLGRAQKVVTVAVAAVVLVNIVVAALGDAVPSSPGGPRASSYGTGSDGVAAYADLLERSGRDVTRLRGRVGPEDLPDGATAIVLDPEQITQAEGAALGRFVQDGGRLVLGGPMTDLAVEAFTGVPVRVEDVDPVDRLEVWAPTTFTGVASELAGDDGDRWVAWGPLLPLAGADGRPTLLTTPVGAGRLLALSDTGPLHNRNLAEADNASFALALAGEGRPVVFVESVHGYAEGGLGSVPSGWKWAAAGLVVALLLGLWAAGTRFGPPEPARRALRPPRRDYVDAVAATMQRGVQLPEDLADPLQDPDVPESDREPVVHLADAVAVGEAAAARRRRAVELGAPPTSATVPARSDPPGAEP